MEIVSYTGGTFKVDLSNYNFTSRNDVVKHTSISITTDDGYVYTFGGDVNSLEYTAISWSDLPPNPQFIQSQASVIDAFFLTKIVAPNKRVLNINYLGGIPAVYQQYTFELLNPGKYNNLIHHQCQLNYILNVSPYEILQNGKELCGLHNPNYIMIELPLFRYTDYDQEIRNDPELGHKQGMSYSLNKIALISSISTDDKHIRFSLPQEVFLL